MNSYAFAITVNSKKRIGGSIHATSMEDAVKRAAAIAKLELRQRPSVIRPVDGKIIKRADWFLDGKRAFLFVYAPAELFA